MEHDGILPGPPSIIGWGSSNQLAEVIRDNRPEKLLFVIDSVLEKISAFHALWALVRSADVAYDVYSDISPEPTLETGKKLVAFARAGQYSMVIGMGGGSALDLAKLAAVFVENDGGLEDYLNLMLCERKN
ncbi:MAG: iron-containing alcohol dehydrogenase [Parapedobacter sp.]|nr:MAG: iron-containing alcohol dehydrogenase [Parapedobacter sp.]